MLFEKQTGEQDTYFPESAAFGPPMLVRQLSGTPRVAPRLHIAQVRMIDD